MSQASQIQIPLSSAVMDAIREFATVLNNTPQFGLFEEYATALNNDEEATRAIEAFQTKQQSLQMMSRLNAVSEADLHELEQLHQAMFDNPTVAGYADAQDRLTNLCLATASVLSEKIGLPFSVKRSSCCG